MSVSPRSRSFTVFYSHFHRSRPRSSSSRRKMPLDVDSVHHPCRESFYFIILNILRSVGGIANGRDADPLFTLIQATETLFRTDFSEGQRLCGLRLCQPCKADFAISTAKAREEVWNLIPRWFEMQISFLDLDEY